MNTTKKLILILLLIPVFIIGGCKKKDKTCNGVPNVGVSFNIDIYGGLYTPLTITGGSMLVNGGNDGIILYRYQTDQFKAYDCMCPYDGASNPKAAVEVQSNGITAKCPICGSVFLLTDGSVSSGPSSCPLKAYNTTFDGNSNLTVSN